MWKKIIYIFIAAVVIFSAFAACEEVEPDPYVRITPDDRQSLVQDAEFLKIVTFTAEKNDIPEGEWAWFVNGEQQSGSKADTFSFKPVFVGTYKIRAAFGGFSSGETAVSVVEKSCKLTISCADADSNILTGYFGSVEERTFTAKVSGTYKEGTNYEAEDILWFVGSDQCGTGFTFNFRPELPGTYIINAALKKYISNSYNYIVKTGDIALTVDGLLNQRADAPESVTFTATPANNVPASAVTWYKDGAVAGTGATLTLTPQAAGVNIIYAAFSAGGNIVESEREYLVCGEPVANLTELNSAVADQSVPAVFITDDILVNSLTVNRPFAIVSDGKTIESYLGADTVISITADNVVIKDLTVKDAGKYNIQYYQCKGGYLENVVLSAAGYSGLHINAAEAVVRNITISESNYGGIELSAPLYYTTAGDKPAILTMLGTFVYDHDLAAPIYTTYSPESCIVVSDILNEFIVKAGAGGSQFFLRRWCGDGCSLGWQLNPPTKRTYADGEILSLAGIAIRVDFCGDSLEFSEEYLKSAFSGGLDMFGGLGIVLEIYDKENALADTLYIFTITGGNYNFADSDGNPVTGELRASDRMIKVYLADLYIGYFIING